MDGIITRNILRPKSAMSPRRRRPAHGRTFSVRRSSDVYQESPRLGTGQISGVRLDTKRNEAVSLAGSSMPVRMPTDIAGRENPWTQPRAGFVRGHHPRPRRSPRFPPARAETDPIPRSRPATASRRQSAPAFSAIPEANIEPDFADPSHAPSFLPPSKTSPRLDPYQPGIPGSMGSKTELPGRPRYFTHDYLRAKQKEVILKQDRLRRAHSQKQQVNQERAQLAKIKVQEEIREQKVNTHLQRRQSMRKIEDEFLERKEDLIREKRAAEAREAEQLQKLAQKSWQLENKITLLKHTHRHDEVLKENEEIQAMDIDDAIDEMKRKVEEIQQQIKFSDGSEEMLRPIAYRSQQTQLKIRLQQATMRLEGLEHERKKLERKAIQRRRSLVESEENIEKEQQELKLLNSDLRALKESIANSEKERIAKMQELVRKREELDAEERYEQEQERAAAEEMERRKRKEQFIERRQLETSQAYTAPDFFRRRSTSAIPKRKPSARGRQESDTAPTSVTERRNATESATLAGRKHVVTASRAIIRTPDSRDRDREPQESTMVSSSSKLRVPGSSRSPSSSRLCQPSRSPISSRSPSASRSPSNFLRLPESCSPSVLSSNPSPNSQAPSRSPSFNKKPAARNGARSPSKDRDTPPSAPVLSSSRFDFNVPPEKASAESRPVAQNERVVDIKKDLKQLTANKTQVDVRHKKKLERIAKQQSILGFKQAAVAIRDIYENGTPSCIPSTSNGLNGSLWIHTIVPCMHTMTYT